MKTYGASWLQRCLVTDGGGALILTAAERATHSRPSRSTSSAPGRDTYISDRWQ
jgi:hypothetical protein